MHNAVERKLCSEGWTRLSRWFIKLPDPKNNKSEATNASISLNFFLNGTTICCAIEPGVPPSLARLRPSMTNPELLPMEVITAPWGLRGYFRFVISKKIIFSALNLRKKKQNNFVVVNFIETLIIV